MSKTSTAVKRRYNEKTYKRFCCDLRTEEYEEIEQVRGDMSRAAFLKMLFAQYKANEMNNAQSEEGRALFLMDSVSVCSCVAASFAAC